MANLQITTKYIRSWEDERKCNDCDDIAIKYVKYPKLKVISVCRLCYEEYYEEQIMRDYNKKGITDERR